MNDFSMDNSILSNRYKIVILGDVSVGKTSLISKIVDSKFNKDYEPSIGIDYSNKVIKYKDKMFKTQIWDTAGQEKYRSLINSYIRGANLVYILFDLTNKDSFNNVASWIDFTSKIVDNISICIIGNKLDLTFDRKVDKDNCDYLSKNYNCKYFEISAKTGENVKDMFYNSIALLPVFSMYTGNQNELVKELEYYNNLDESNISKSYLSNRDTINLETAKNNEQVIEAVNDNSVIKDNNLKHNKEVNKTIDFDKKNVFGLNKVKLKLSNKIKIKKDCKC